MKWFITFVSVYLKSHWYIACDEITTTQKCIVNKIVGVDELNVTIQFV